MDCSKNFHSSLDFVNSASKHSVVQHCTAVVSKHQGSGDQPPPGIREELN